MSIERLLSSFGLREKKAAVYQAVLERGSSTVLPLAQRAGINRTTAYDILEDLQIRGLVIYKEIRGRRYYQATDPRRFKHILEQQQKEVEQSLPELLALYKPSKEKPATRFFEGKEEIALIYQELLKASSIDAYGDFTRINSFYPDFPKYVQQQINRGIKIRDLVPFGTKLDELSSQYRSPKQELRY
ncbi:MAG: TrmB family transcriptional regulator, partial [Candidatus Paceibacterota bacterium]